MNDRELEDPQANPARVLKPLAQVLADLEHGILRHRAGEIRIERMLDGSICIIGDLWLESAL